MKKTFTILSLLLIGLGIAWLFSPTPDPEALKPRTDLPWQITPLANGNSRVLDLELGRATLADAIAKFGEPEDIAVFQPEDGAPGLEVYFGNVAFGLLKAKIVLRLATRSDEIDALITRADKREGSSSGAWKFILTPADRAAQLQRRITVITYLPGTRNLDADFFRARLGEPTAWLQESEYAISWFYPDKGLSLLIDADNSEVFEFVPPRSFVMPDGVTPSQ